MDQDEGRRFVLLRPPPHLGNSPKSFGPLRIKPNIPPVGRAPYYWENGQPAVSFLQHPNKEIVIEPLDSTKRNLVNRELCYYGTMVQSWAEYAQDASHVQHLSGGIADRGVLRFPGGGAEGGGAAAKAAVAPATPAGQESGAVSCGTSTSQHEAGLYADVGGCTLLEESARDGDGLERLVARLRAHHLQRRAVDARARLRRHLQGVGSREMGY